MLVDEKMYLNELSLLLIFVVSSSLKMFDESCLFVNYFSLSGGAILSERLILTGKLFVYIMI